MKKTWETPKLIVLVRSKPQEAVLDVCKFLHLGAVPMDTFPGCAIVSQDGCSPCSAQVGT